MFFTASSFILPFISLRMNNTLFGLGVVLIILGILAGFFGISNGTLVVGNETNRPYATLSIPLVIVGIILLIIGAIVPTRTVVRERSYTTTPERRTKRVVEEE